MCVKASFGSINFWILSNSKSNYQKFIVRSLFYESDSPLFQAIASGGSGQPYHSSLIKKNAADILISNIIAFVGTPVELTWWTYRHCNVEHISCDIEGTTEAKSLNLTISLRGKTRLPNDISLGSFELYDSVDAFYFIKALQQKLQLKHLAHSELGFGFAPSTNAR